MKCRVNIGVSYVLEPERASWLCSDFQPGPRSKRIGSVREAVSGPVISTETNWMPDGSQATELQRAFHMKHLAARREALAKTAAHLRQQSRCREASLATEELRAVTNEILAMGWRE